jgi:hypothetical protein
VMLHVEALVASANRSGAGSCFGDNGIRSNFPPLPSWHNYAYYLLMFGMDGMWLYLALDSRLVHHDAESSGRWGLAHDVRRGCGRHTVFLRLRHQTNQPCHEIENHPDHLQRLHIAVCDALSDLSLVVAMLNDGADRLGLQQSTVLFHRHPRVTSVTFQHNIKCFQSLSSTS